MVSCIVSKNNCADILSRGAYLQDLAASPIWWSGPDFLRDPEFRYENIKKSYDYDPNSLPEIRNTIISFHAEVASESEVLFPSKQFSQYSITACSGQLHTYYVSFIMRAAK